ncbi:hypothetical protein ABPG72_005388 [Tetrahymena utriculariae]
MATMITTIAKDLLKEGVAQSLGAFALSQVKKVTDSKAFKTKILQFVSAQSEEYKKKYVMAKNIILISSQESEIDIDQKVLQIVPNQEVSLTEEGAKRSGQIGNQIQKYLDELSKKSKKQIKISAYSSPYQRAKQTLEQMKKQIKNDFLVEVDLNLRDQDLGNLPKDIKCEEIEKERQLINPFYFRYENGESEADVFLRASTFTNTIIRQIRNFDRNQKYQNEEKVVIVVAHPVVIQQLQASLERFDSQNLLNIKTFTQ